MRDFLAAGNEGNVSCRSRTAVRCGRVFEWARRLTDAQDEPASWRWHVVVAWCNRLAKQITTDWPAPCWRSCAHVNTCQWRCALYVIVGFMFEMVHLSRSMHYALFENSCWHASHWLLHGFHVSAVITGDTSGLRRTLLMGLFRALPGLFWVFTSVVSVVCASSGYETRPVVSASAALGSLTLWWRREAVSWTTTSCRTSSSVSQRSQRV